MQAKHAAMLIALAQPVRPRVKLIRKGEAE